MNTNMNMNMSMPIMDDIALFRLLELNDALFPIGAYAHSYGLETYVQAGFITDRKTAETWLRAYFSGSFLYSELLPARLAYGYSSAEDAVQMLQLLEEELVAARSPREPREAMLKLGSRLAKNVQKIGLPTDGRFADYLEAVHGRCSYPVCYGVLSASLQLSLGPSLQHYLYAQISSLTNTCVKLVPLSQTDGAAIVADFAPTFVQLMEKVFQASRNDLCRSTPGLDIRSMQHEDLYSRLYMS